MSDAELAYILANELADEVVAAVHPDGPYAEPAWLSRAIGAKAREAVDIRDPHRLQVVGLSGRESKRRKAWHEEQITAERLILVELLAAEIASHGQPSKHRTAQIAIGARGRIRHHLAVIDALENGPGEAACNDPNCGPCTGGSPTYAFTSDTVLASDDETRRRRRALEESRRKEPPTP